MLFKIYEGIENREIPMFNKEFIIPSKFNIDSAKKGNYKLISLVNIDQGDHINH